MTATGSAAPVPESPRASEPPLSHVRAGRGFLWLTGAKLHFMLMGWGVYFVLPRLMDRVDWGRYLSVLFLVSILNNVMVATGVQGVSRFTAAAGPGRAWLPLRSGLGLFALLGGSLSLGLFLAAPLVAALHQDPSLTPLYRAAAWVALAYAVYAALVGSLNGRQRFAAQAGFDAAYATLRFAGILGGALVLGRGAAALGAHAGYSVAAGIIGVAALALVGLPLWRAARRQDPEAGGAPPAGGASPAGAAPPDRVAARRGSTAPDRSPSRPGWGPLVLFALPVALHQLGLNLLLRTDAILVKALGGATLHAAHASLGTIARAGSLLASLYGTGQVFALLPYQALIALSMVVFPLVADAQAGDRPEALRRTARGAIRFALLFGLGLAALLSAQPAGLIDLVYPSPYREAGVALQLQAWGVVGLSLVTLACTMLNASGHTVRVVLLTAAIWGVQTAAVALALPHAGTVPEALQFAAGASTAALLLGGMAALGLVWLTFGVALPFGTAARGLAAAAVAFGLGRGLAPRSALGVVAVAALSALAYLGVLVALREIRQEDLAAAGRLLGRQRSA